MAERDDYSEYPDWMMGALARVNDEAPAYPMGSLAAQFPEVTTGPDTPIMTERQRSQRALQLARRGEGVNPAADVIRSIPSAVVSGLGNFISQAGLSPGPIAFDPQRDLFAEQTGLPTSADTDRSIRAASESLYQPQTRLGRYGHSVFEMGANPINWVGPGSIPFKAGFNVLSGVGGEAGAEAAAGTGYENAARFAGSLGPAAAERAIALARFATRPKIGDLAATDRYENAGGAYEQSAPVPRSTEDAFNTLKTGAEKASQDYTKSLLPPPTSFMDRIWQNYAKRMTPDELLQSEPLWGGAQQLAQATGMSEQQAFAHIANNMLERMGTGTRLTPEAANQITGEQRGAAMLSDVLRRPQAQSGRMGDIADQQAILRDAIVRGRSGRPIRTAPLPIGTEDAILQRGYDVATGQVQPGPQPPFTQAAARKGPVLLKAGGEEGVAAPAILPRQMPTAEDINAIKAAARGFGHNPWPTAERPIFKTTPEAYNETSQLVPQVSIKGRLPGPLPGEKLPGTGRVAPFIENADAIGSLMAERLQPLVQAQSPLLKFYSTGPVIRGLERYGEAPQGPVQFMRDWAGQGAATSPRTKTPPNLRNASFLMYERARGNPMTRARFDVEGNEPGYSMMGMHVDLANAFAHGTENPLVNPKPTTFRENWAGNLLDVTGDTHVIRGGLHYLDMLYPGELPPGWFTNAAAYDLYRSKGLQAVPPGGIKDTLDGRTVAKAFRQAEYLPITEPTYRAAQQLGIAPAEVQSGGWFSLGDLTNLRSPPKTIPHLLNDQIEATARAASVPNETALNWWSRGLIPLAGVAGAAKMGELARQDDYQQ